MSMKIVAGALASVLLVGAPAGAHPAGPSGCGATAPLTIQCSSGWHLFDGSHDEAAIDAGTFTGTVESALHYLDAAVGIQCSYIAGMQQGCLTFGAVPPTGTPVYHTCTSFVIPVVHGGIGEYGCLLH